MARIDDGFPTTIGFASNPTVKFYEKSITPPGMDGGGANDTTTMRNLTLRTKAPKKLKSLDDATFTASYDPAVYTEVWSMINVNQSITITFPDLSTLQFWGYLNSFRPNEIREGEQPTAAVNIVPTNQNATGVEAAPVYTAPPP